MTIVPFTLQAGVGCSAPAELAIALAAEFHAVDEQAVDSAIDQLGWQLLDAAPAAPEDQLGAVAALARDFTARRGGMDADHLLLDRVLACREGHPALIAVAVQEAARRSGYPVGLVGDGFDVWIAHTEESLPMLVDVATGRVRGFDPEEAERLSWRCGHQIVYLVLRELIDRSLHTGDVTRALHGAELRLSLPLSADLRDGARAELGALRARLN